MIRLKWTLRDGSTSTEYDSFPYAFRSMFLMVKKGVETGQRKYDDMMRQLSIVGPQKDRDGKPKVYSYAEAAKMATASGLLTADGTINSREFKKQF